MIVAAMRDPKHVLLAHMQKAAYAEFPDQLNIWLDQLRRYTIFCPADLV